MRPRAGCRRPSVFTGSAAAAKVDGHSNHHRDHGRSIGAEVTALYPESRRRAEPEAETGRSGVPELGLGVLYAGPFGSELMRQHSRTRRHIGAHLGIIGTEAVSEGAHEGDNVGLVAGGGVFVIIASEKPF